METFSRATALSLVAICCAFVLLVAVFFGLLRPPLPSLGAGSQRSLVQEDNWFSERTFQLLSTRTSPLTGVDTELDPFKRPAWASEPVQVELLPPVEPEPDPPPPPPSTREVSLVYRGFYQTSRGEAFVYLEVENTTQVFPINGEPVPGWTIIGADGRALILGQEGEVRKRLPFNQKKSLEVPIQ